MRLLDLQEAIHRFQKFKISAVFGYPRLLGCVISVLAPMAVCAQRYYPKVAARHFVTCDVMRLAWRWRIANKARHSFDCCHVRQPVLAGAGRHIGAALRALLGNGLTGFLGGLWLFLP